MFTSEAKEERKRELIELIDKGIEKMRENHMRRVAEAEVYSHYSLTEIMDGSWIANDSANLGTAEFPLYHVANLVDVPMGVAFSILTAKIERCTRELVEKYDGGAFKNVLEKARRIGLEQIDKAATDNEAQCIISRAGRIVLECSESRPWIAAPWLYEEGEIVPYYIPC
jgi:hypothetical protein